MLLIAPDKGLDVKILVFLKSPNYAVPSSVTDQYHKYEVMCVIQDKTDELGSVLPFSFSNYIYM